MGGMIAVAVRFKDGSIVTHERTTGAADWWMRDIKIALGDEDYLRAYLANPTDWDPVIEFGPVDYGMIVVDLVGQRIHEMNDYSSIPRASTIQHSSFGIDPELAEKWKEFADAGRIKVTGLRIKQERIDRDAREGRAVPATPMPAVDAVLSWDEILPLVSERPDAADRDVYFEFDLAPMRYANYATNLEGTKALRASLEADGFDVSSALWDQRIADYEEAERDEAIEGD